MAPSAERKEADTGKACGVAGISGLMDTQEFDLPGVTFVGPESYRAATMLLAAKAFLSLLLGLTVTYAWVVMPQAGKAPPLVQVGRAPAGMARQGSHPGTQVTPGPVRRAQSCDVPDA